MDEVRTLLTGRGLVESPRWHDDRLYFSDWSAGEVLAVDLAGRSEVVAQVKSLPLCTAFLPDGGLVIVSSPDGQLLRREPDGSLVLHADLGSPDGTTSWRTAGGTSTSTGPASTPWRGRSSGLGLSSWPRRTARCARWPATSRFPTGWR